MTLADYFAGSGWYCIGQAYPEISFPGHRMSEGWRNVLTIEQPPIRIEVSRPRLTEGAPGVLRVRMVNLTGEPLTCALSVQGSLTDGWTDTPTLLPPGGTGERRVPTRDQTRGTFVVHVSADIIEGVGGLSARYVGQIDREIDALSSGAAAISVNIAGGDGAVIDASQLRLGQSDELRNIRGHVEYEAVDLVADQIGSGLIRATIADHRGLRLHVVTGDRLVIGRDPERADLVATPGVVSGVHVEIAKLAEQFICHHRSGTNRTLLNQSSVTGDRSVTLSEDTDSTLLLGGEWRCRIRVIRHDETAASVRRGLIERGMPVESPGSNGIAGLLFLPDNEGGTEFVPMLWLNTAARLHDAVLDEIDDRGIVLSAFCGLQAVRLADDGRVLSVSDLCIDVRIGESYRVVDGRC